MNQINPFSNLSTEGLEKATDSLGTSGPLDSDVYTGTIKLAFTGKSDGGANFVEVHIETANNRVYRERLWVTNKQGQQYYERDKKKIPLPGFTTANDLALLSTGQELNSQTFEEKIVKLYDFSTRGEIPQTVLAITSMMGKDISIGVLRVLENKSVKNEQTGIYEPTDETREINNIDKVFHAETGKTVSEFVAKAETAEFQDKWLAKNKGQIRNKVKSVEGKSGVPGAAKPATGGNGGASKSLFG